MADELLVKRAGRRLSSVISILTVGLIVVVGLCPHASCQDAGAGEQARREYNGLNYRQLTRQIFQGEHDTIELLKRAHLITETYIQSLAHVQRDGMDTDLDELSEHIVDDAYFLGSVDLQHLRGSLPSERLLFGKPWRDRYIRINNDLYEKLIPIGQLMLFFVDLTDFDTDTYTLTYIRRERRLNTECLLFAVTPTHPRSAGRFSGTIWVESSSLKIVGIKGVFLGPYVRWYKPILWQGVYFHFDSWRERVSEGIWLPTSAYFEERRTFSADGNLQFHLRGYSLLWQHGDKGLPSLTTAHPDTVANDSTPPSAYSEVDPLVRLEANGLLAVPGAVEQKLDEIAGQTAAHAGVQRAIHCRILLTTPAELFSVGNTIVVSRGLLNILPDDKVLAVLLARQIAHIVLGHSQDFVLHLPNNPFASADKRDFPGLGIKYGPGQEQAADRETVALLRSTDYEKAAPAAKEFLSRLQTDSCRFPNLVRPRFGIAVVSPGNGRRHRSTTIASDTSNSLRFRDLYGVSWNGIVTDRTKTNEPFGTEDGQENGPISSPEMK